MIVDQFDEMREQSRQQPLVMGIALHPYLVGQPYRLRHLRRALEHVARARDGARSGGRRRAGSASTWRRWRESGRRRSRELGRRRPHRRLGAARPLRRRGRRQRPVAGPAASPPRTSSTSPASRPARAIRPGWRRTRRRRSTPASSSACSRPARRCSARWSPTSLPSACTATTSTTARRSTRPRRTRVPGGSSSGSAAAVAARLVDFALATDTGGSTRVPASYCGLWGLRTTQGLVSTRGLVPLAPGFDTATWLAHDAVTFARVGGVLLPEATAGAATADRSRRCV